MLALVMPPRPEPVKDEVITPPPSVEEYAKLTEVLELKLGALTPKAAVLGFMQRKSIPHYDLGQVDGFLDALTKQSGEQWCWMPLRMRDAALAPDEVDGHYTLAGSMAMSLVYGACATVAAALIIAFAMAPTVSWPIIIVACLVGLVAFHFALTHLPKRIHVGYTENRAGLYKKLIPIEHLKHMRALRDEFPELSFFVSEFGVVPDPFIMCTTHQGWRIVFGVWDEPGFGAI